MDTTDLLSTVHNRGKEFALVQFNKITGEFTGVFQDVPVESLNCDYYDYARVQIDIETETVIGKFPEFKVVPIKSQPAVVLESMFNNNMQVKIDKEYPLNVRLRIIEVALNKIASHLNVECSELSEMCSVLAEIERTNTVMKESLKSDPAFKFVTLQEEEEQNNAKIEGGLHELFGPRNSIG